jgi:hypothetical protein
VSTIKSSAEHLTVTSDGTNKHTYIQDNGVTKVATTTTGIDVTGNITSTISSGENKLIVSATAASQSAKVSLQTNATTPGQAILYMGKSSASTNGQVGYNPNNDSMYFYTNNTEKLRIQSGGDVKVNTGNLVIGTAGKGIDFSAQTATATGTTTAEVLDSYEEGTWTPSFTNPDDADGTYTKVGNYVYCTALISCTGVGGSGINIGGLPFTPLGGTGERGGGSIIYQSADSTAWNCIVNAASQVSMYAGAASKSLASGQVAYFSFSYRAA